MAHKAIDTVAAHLELRGAAARVLAELGRPEAARFARLAERAAERLAETLARHAEHAARRAELDAAMTVLGESDQARLLGLVEDWRDR